MALTSDQATRLALLQGAYDRLICGQQLAEIDYAGRRTVYSKADISRLKQEIDGLNAIAASSTGRLRGAVGFRL